MNTNSEYQRRKAQARAQAIEWQRKTSEAAPSWGDLAVDFARFSKLARRYGLTREFRENGII